MRPPFGLLLTGEGLCRVEFQGALEDAQNGFVGSAVVRNPFHQMRIPGWLRAIFAHPKLVIFEKRSTENGLKGRSKTFITLLSVVRRVFESAGFVTRTNTFFMFLHSAQHRHGQATKTAFLPH